MKICVYCSSSSKINEKYFKATENLAKEFIIEKISLVYGGGGAGLMGHLADTIIDNGGKIKGISPRFMKDIEWTHKRLTDLELVDTMHERKSKFLEGIDGIVALPGGCGTLDELIEVITFKRLGLFTKPIIILNVDGFYDPFKEMLEKCVDEKFMDDKHLDMWQFVDDYQDVIPSIKNAKPWNSDALNFARKE
ncbi:MAG: TIGR00730 family Rossman fold protein [Bacteroidota bacterium]